MGKSIGNMDEVGAWLTVSLHGPLQIEASGQVSELHLYNLSSLDNNCKITCSAENIVGENESSVFLDILCEFQTWL